MDSCLKAKCLHTHRIRMGIFQSGRDMPTLVRISLRTLQYLVIPLLSIAVLVFGSTHLGQCKAQPLLPVWHIVAGVSGMLASMCCLPFDEINPRLSRRLPAVSNFCDNQVAILLPFYILFQISWLITGTVWILGSEEVETPDSCNHDVYVFSLIVIGNLWIYISTALIFMLALCCTRIFPYCAYCGYWNIMKTVIENWTGRIRMEIAFAISWPLGIAMIIAGAFSVSECKQSSNNETAPIYDFSPKKLKLLNSDCTSGGLDSTNLTNLSVSPTKPPTTSKSSDHHQDGNNNINKHGTTITINGRRRANMSRSSSLLANIPTCTMQKCLIKYGCGHCL